jgi:enoyl-[acyl-carrier protein] reductase I
MLLEGKRLLVTGVLTDDSIAFAVARKAQEHGAELVLTSFGRAMRLTQRMAKRLPVEPDVLELDVTSPPDLAALTAELEGRWGGLDGALHAIGFAPKASGGGSIVALDFDNRGVAWPIYDWMGVAKAALESTARYLARDLGQHRVRVNLVCAGPVRTVAARSIPGFERFEEVWAERAPLGWDVRDPDPVAGACVALFSDLFPATTGEMLHVDGGFHATGA